MIATCDGVDMLIVMGGSMFMTCLIAAVFLVTVGTKLMSKITAFTDCAVRPLSLIACNNI